MKVPHPDTPCAIGFTGTRRGMTPAQAAGVRDLLAHLAPIGRLVHGDCIGADAEMHAIMRDYDPTVRIETRPGVSAHRVPEGTFRAYCQADREHEPETHFARNRKIVDGCDFLIATPAEMAKQDHGGTWYTIDYAERRGVDFLIVFPNGSVRGPATEDPPCLTQPTPRGRPGWRWGTRRLRR